MKDPQNPPKMCKGKLLPPKKPTFIWGKHAKSQMLNQHMPVSCGSCTWVCQVFLEFMCRESSHGPAKKPLYCSHFLFQEVANFGVAKMSPKKNHPYRLDQWIKVDAGAAGELFCRPCRRCGSDFVWRYGCVNAQCVPRRSISHFFCTP